MITLEQAVELAKIHCGNGNIKLYETCYDIGEGWVFMVVRKNGRVICGMPALLVYKNDGKQEYKAYFPGNEFAEKVDTAERIDIKNLVTTS